MKGCIQLRSPSPIDYDRLVFLAYGASGIVYAIDEERVLKEYYDDNDVELQVLERLGLHNNVVKCFGTADKGIILERGRSLRTVIQESKADQIPLDKKICWLQDAAMATQYLHDNGILHADVGCNNWILVGERLKLIDFEGCSIDDGEAGACYEWFSYKDSTPTISRKTDIFAFGCAMYELITGRQPHDELLPYNDRIVRIKQKYAENQFPEVENVPLGNAMQGCWYGAYNSMSEIIEAIKGARLPSIREPMCPTFEG